MSLQPYSQTLQSSRCSSGRLPSRWVVITAGACATSAATVAANNAAHGACKSLLLLVHMKHQRISEYLPRPMELPHNV